MIIQSEVYKDTKANFFNNEITFDKEGKATIKKDLGEKIVENFPKIWEEGKKPELKKVKETPTDNLELSVLKDEVNRLKSIITTKDRGISDAKAGEKTWRDAYAELEAKMKNPVTPEVKNENNSDEDEFIVPEGMEDLYAEMKPMAFLSLKKWIKDNFDKTDEDIKDLSDKESLMKFVFDNTKGE